MNDHEHSRLPLALAIALFLVVITFQVIDQLSTRPDDVLERVEALELKLEIAPADVLRELGGELGELKAEVRKLSAR